MATIKIKCPPLYPQSFLYGGKVAVIEAIRTLTGLGLKEAKDLSEVYDKFTDLNIRYIPREDHLTKVQLDILTANGVEVQVLGDYDVVAVDDIISKLRNLAVECIGIGKFDLADDIYAIVLKGK